METICIQFTAPKSDANAREDGFFKRSIQNLAIKVLAKIIPVANPDFENKIDDVEHWLVECDKETGEPQREIGIDASGRVIMKMPFNNNYGYWTDNNLLLAGFKEHFNATEISQETFEQSWALLHEI